MGSRIVFPLRRLAHLTRDEFQAYWFDVHGPLVASHADTLGIVRYQQVHTRQEARSTAVACFDERNFLDIDASPVFLGEVRVVIAP